MRSLERVSSARFPPRNKRVLNVLVLRLRGCLFRVRVQVASVAQLGASLKPKKQADNTFLREDIPKNVKRVIIKVGTSVLTRDQEFGVSLTRLASLVEQVSALVHMGKEVIIVTSGAVGFGKMKLQVCFDRPPPTRIRIAISYDILVRHSERKKSSCLCSFHVTGADSHVADSA